MITAGVDMGAKFIKVLILKDGEIAAKTQELAGFEPIEVAQKAFANAVAEAGIAEGDIQAIFATGAGRKSAPLAKDSITEVNAAARGVAHTHPSVRTIIEVGAEEGRAVKCDDKGKVEDFAINEKCAAGAGSFTEAMSRALEVPLDEFGKISLQSTKSIPMNAQCAVFAESEVVSLVHAKTPKHDIAKAVHDAIASRIVSMVRRVGINNDVALIGGVSYNPGFVDALKRGLETEVIVPDSAEFVGALGAAIVAGERGI
ncbi:MAG: CoA activase [candidate division Zixibacteria bacterium]|nr:CoA activase [candidate division Zixibacteria bacterium]